MLIAMSHVILRYTKNNSLCSRNSALTGGSPGQAWGMREINDGREAPQVWRMGRSGWRLTQWGAGQGQGQEQEVLLPPLRLQDTTAAVIYSP